MQPCLLPCKALTGHARRGLVRRTFSQIVQSYPQPIPHLLISSHQTLYSIPIPLLYRVLPTEAWTFCLYLPNFNPGARVYRRQRFSSRSYWYCITITRVCSHNHPPQQVAHERVNLCEQERGRVRSMITKIPKSILEPISEVEDYTILHYTCYAMKAKASYHSMHAS